MNCGRLPSRSRAAPSQMVNSTAVGGGVAEILNRFVPLAEELGLRIRWDVMTGGEDFFDVTKSFHNALHGEPYHPDPRDFDVFRAYTDLNLRRLSLDSEFVVIHDPQPAGLSPHAKILPRTGSGAATSISPIPIARSGISLSLLSPNMTARSFLRPNLPASSPFPNIFSIPP